MTKVTPSDHPPIKDKVDFSPANGSLQITVDEAPRNKKKAKEKDEDDKKEEEDKFKLPPVGIFSLFKYSTTKERVMIFIAILAAVTAGLCMPAMIILFGDITNAFVDFDMTNLTDITNETIPEEIEEEIKDNFFDTVIVFGAGTGIIGVIQLITGYIFVTTLNYAAEGQVFRLRSKFLYSILRQEIGWFDTHQTNDFASRVTEDLNKLQEGIGEKVGMFIFFFVTFFSSLINAFIHGWELTLVILSVFPLLGISTGILAKAQSTLTETELKEYAKAGSVAEEVISGIRTVAAFGGEEKEVNRYTENLTSAKKAGIRRGLVSGLGLGFMWLIIYAAYALAFWYGTKLIIDSRNSGSDRYGPDALIIVFFSVLMGAMNVGQAAPYVEAFNVARGAAATIFSVIERTSAIDPANERGDKLSNISGTIEFEDIHFNYPSRPDVNILQGFDVKIQPGQTVALVGSSGCGKSTCIQLLQRFYDPLKGQVKLDGKNIVDYNLGWLRDQIGVVGQEPVLFGTTIGENIRYGREGVSMAEITDAAMEANAHDFILKMPKGYDTQVGERGTQMSGGQKQRIAIARALVKKPKILLLDEATSALDNQSEAIVQAALDKVRLGRTTIIVAHRLTTIKTADVIVALKDGQIAETGSHDELMKLEGLYYSLVTAQLSAKDKDKSKDNAGLIEEADDDVEITAEEALMDELTSMSPVTLARAPSARRSIRRRGSSTSISSKKNRSSFKRQKSNIEANTLEDDEEDENLAITPLSKIMKANSNEWPYVLGGVLGAGIQGSVIPIYAILFGDVLGNLATLEESEARDNANFYALLFLIIGLIAGASMFFQSYMFAISGEALTMRLRQLTFKAMLDQEMGWFDEEKNTVGALCSRLSGDASAVQGATGSRIGTIVQAIATLGLSMALAMYFEWRLGLTTLPFIPFVLIAIYLQSKILMGQSLTESKVLEQSGKIAIEAITNIRTVAMLHKEKMFSNMYSDALYAPHKEALKKSHLRGLSFGFAQCVPFLAYSVVMFYGGYLVRESAIPYANVFKVAESLILGTMMVGQAVAFAPNYNKARVSASKIFALLERVPLINSSRGVGLGLNKDIATIDLEKVTFHYPTRPNVPILKGLNVQVNKGKTLALVGSSGCGKSTIIGLLERFYDAASGTVRINNTDIENLNVGSVRSRLGLVSQEPTLFDRTIKENITYGDNSRQIPDAEIIEAAKQANIHEFITSLPDGYNTRVGAKGTQLSGGQKQRIAIARALIRNPSLLMLDEATSALDTESEKVVQEALEKAQEGRTSIVIAHRLSTIKNADTIAVIQAGVVVECGTHDELMEMKANYYNLYQTNK